MAAPWSLAVVSLSLVAWRRAQRGVTSARPADPMAASARVIFFDCFPSPTVSLPTSLPPSLQSGFWLQVSLGVICLILDFTSKVLGPSLLPSPEVWPKSEWLLGWEWEKQPHASQLSKTLLCLSLSTHQSLLQGDFGRCLHSSTPQENLWLCYQTEALLTIHVASRNLPKYLF